MMKRTFIVLSLLALTCHAVDIVLGRFSDLTWTGSGNDRVATFGTTFNPQSVSGLVAWWDAETALADGTAVTNMPDRSGNGYNATQSTTERKPTLVSAGLNGRNVVSFDGGDELIHSLSQTTAATSFAVFKLDAVMDTWQILLYCDSAPLCAEAAGYSGQWGTYQNTALSSGYSATSWSVVIDVTRNYDDIDLISNGNPVHVAGVSWYSTPGNRSIGSSGSNVQFFNGKLAEMLVYSRALTTNETRQVQQYLSTKWGVSVSNGY